MSEDEVEKFEITDYDLDNEFNINRRRRRPTKNQQIYGMWADDSDGEDESRNRPGYGRQKTRRNRADFSGPISFVAGGVQQSGKKKDKGKNDEGEQGDEEEDDDDEEEAGTSRRFANSSSEDSDDGGRSGFGLRSITTDIDADTAGLRKKRAPVNTTLIQKGVGNWEKHTKGIGAKLLLQMGYQPGRGLGKELQGISAPVEAHLRKGRGAIGAYGPEKVTKMKDLRPEMEEEETTEDQSEEGKLSQWRKDGSKKSKVKYVYKSVDDVLEDEGKGKQYKREFNELTKVKVIDMTGPQQRVLSGYHAISGPQRPADEWEHRKDKKFSNFALPELQHNLNLLVDMCEQDIIANDRKLRHVRDRVVALEQEEVTLNQKVAQEEKQIAMLDSVLNVVQRLENSSLDKLSLEEVADAFKKLQDEHYEEYRLYNLGDLAPEILKPMLQVQMKDWTPLDDPTKFTSVFKQWKGVLESECSAISMRSTMTLREPYHRLVWETWMPAVRPCILSWNGRDFEPVMRLLEVWYPLIPIWISDNILEQNILPRIQEAVEEWNPLTDTVQVHTWIFPWLPRLGQHFETTVFPTIRNKLSTALLSWDPSDPSAHFMLEPWAKVFSKGDMDAFLVKNILPKLQLTMSELIINPHHQILNRWDWVMSWEDLLPIHTLASLLDKLFFPKWLQVLTLWLNHSPDYEQISNWYTGWKLMFPATLAEQPIIKEHFRKALELMNRAVSNPGKPVVSPAPEPTKSFPEQGESSSATQQQRYADTMVEAVRTASQIPQGFRDLLQKRCEERGIIFVPLIKRWREGQQVYRMGNVQVYFDRNVVFVNSNGIWQPTSLHTALEMAVS